MAPPKCGICFSYASSKDEDYFVNTLCGHMYHYSCITSWIDEGKENNPARCPICRSFIDYGNLIKLHGISPLLQAREEDNHVKYNIKITLLGDSGTGKTSMLHSFTHDQFKPDCSATRGVDMGFKTLDFAGKKIKLTVWDCAGQDRFRAICPSYIRNSHGVILVYDVTDPKSFQHLDEWLNVVYETAPPEVSILLAANKCDLVEERQITTKQGEDAARSSGFEFMETSARDVINLEAAFRTILGRIIASLWDDGYIDSFEVLPSSSTIKLNSTESNSVQRRSSCRC